MTIDASPEGAGPEGEDHSGGSDTGTVHPRAGAGFWVAAVLGWAIIIGIGLRGIFSHHIDTRPTNLAWFVAGGALLHDIVFAPLALLFGVAVARIVRGRARAVVQATLVITGVVALFSYPLVRAYGRGLHNPSSLPRNYTANLAIVLGIVWAGAAAAVVVRMRRVGPPAPD